MKNEKKNMKNEKKNILRADLPSYARKNGEKNEKKFYCILAKINSWGY